MDQEFSVRLRQISFYILLVALGCLLFTRLSGFLPSFLGAVTFYVIMRKYMLRMVYKRKMKKGLAAAALILLSILTVLVPLWIFASLVGHRISDAVKHSNDVLAAIKHFADTIQTKYGLELLSNDNINKASGIVANLLPNIVGATFKSLTSFFMLYFMLYFMLTQSKEMEAALIKELPLKDVNIIWLGKDLQELTFNNAVGVPLIAIFKAL